MSDTHPNTGVDFGALLHDVQALVKREAHPRRRTLEVSPEVAALLEGIGPVATPPAAEAPPCNIEQFEALRLEISQCTKCGLAESRTQTVFGAGNPNADLVFVGEAPGEHEDLQGIPFVGRAGGLLTDIIEKGMQMTRDDVFICNVLKCRPPGNRDPHPDERAACEPFLVRQLSMIRPKVICALGGHAAKMLLKTEDSVGKLRGKWHFYQGIPVRVTYHPAYVLRSERDAARHKADKRRVWEDIQEVMRVLKGEVTLQAPSGASTDSPDLLG